jgi:hypothetical protein
MARASTDDATARACASCRLVEVVVVDGEDDERVDDDAWTVPMGAGVDDLNARDALEASTSLGREEEDGAVDEGGVGVSSGGDARRRSRRRRPWWALGVETAASVEAATRRAATTTSVVDIVPTEDGGKTRARIARAHEASLMRFVEDVQFEERMTAEARAPKRTRTPARTFRVDASAATARFRRVTTRGFGITKRVLAKRAREMFGVSARVVGELQKEELRRDAFAATRRGAIFTKRAIQGIKVQVPPLVGFRFDERHVTALWARFARAVSKRVEFVAKMRRERLARNKQREEEAKAKAEASSKRAEKERAEAPPQDIYMRDLIGIFDKVSDDRVAVEPEAFAELLSPQSIATNVDADGALRILAAEPSLSTPQTVEISVPGVDITFDHQSVDNYSLSRFLAVADSDDATFESPRREDSSAQSHSVHDISMSPDPQAKAFVRRIEDDLEQLAQSDVEEHISMRILSREDKRLASGALRGWLDVCEKHRAGEYNDDADVAEDEAALMALFDASLASKVELAKRVFALDGDSDEFDDLLEEAAARSAVDITAAHSEASEAKEGSFEEPAEAVDTANRASERPVDAVVNEHPVVEFDEVVPIAMNEQAVNDDVDAPVDIVTSEQPMSEDSELSQIVTSEAHVRVSEHPGESTMIEDDGSDLFQGSVTSEEMLEELIEDSGVEIYPPIPVDVLDRYADEVRSLSEQLALMKSEQRAMSQLAERREMELRNSISLVRGQVEIDKIDNEPSEIIQAQKEELNELKEELNRLKSTQDSVLRMVDEKNSVFRQSLVAERKEQSATVPSSEEATQSKEIEELKQLIVQLKSEQEKLTEESERRERELRTSFAAEKDDLEKKLRESLTVERMQLEEEFAKSLMIERGGLEEQLHKGDEYLDSEIQRLQEELVRVKAEQVNALVASSQSPQASNQPLVSQSTPGTPLFTIDAETDVSMEWDVYQLREELDAVKAASASILQLADARGEELRRSLSLDKASVESAIRREVARALGQIEVQSVNASHDVAQRASRAQKLLDDASSLVKDNTSRAQDMLDKAKSFAQKTVERLKERERELNALTSAQIDVSPLKPALSPGGPKATISALERARQRRRLLHGVTDTFSLSEIINQAQTLATEMEFRMNK